MNEEKWVDVKGFEDSYQVSSCGRVRSKDRYVEMKNGGKRFCRGVVMTNVFDGLKYYKVMLTDSEKKKNTNRIHRLMAENFLDNPNGYTHVNFINNDPTDLRLENLKWVAGEESNAKGARIGNKSELRKGNK